MKFEEKVINMMNAIKNAYKDEDNQDTLLKMELNDGNITEDITAMLYAMNLFLNQISGEEIDIIDFTHILNKLAVQYLLEVYEEGEGK